MKKITHDVLKYTQVDSENSNFAKFRLDYSPIFRSFYVNFSFLCRYHESFWNLMAIATISSEFWRSFRPIKTFWRSSRWSRASLNTNIFNTFNTSTQSRYYQAFFAIIIRVALCWHYIFLYTLWQLEYSLWSEFISALRLWQFLFIFYPDPVLHKIQYIFFAFQPKKNSLHV